jgi:glucans biosynthesis protein
MVRRREILRTAVVLAAGQVPYANWVSAAAPPQSSTAAAGTAPTAPAASQAATGTGPAKAFDFAWLKGQARFLAGNPFQPSKDTLPPAMAALGYDQYQSLRFKPDHSLWGDTGAEFRLAFFHVGRSFTQPVHLYEVVDGQAREILYDPAMFDFKESGVDPNLMKDHAGFAGFRVQFVTDWRADVAAFLGAAYFRAVGGDTRQ